MKVQHRLTLARRSGQSKPNCGVAARKVPPPRFTDGQIQLLRKDHFGRARFLKLECACPDLNKLGTKPSTHQHHSMGRNTGGGGVDAASVFAPGGRGIAPACAADGQCRASCGRSNSGLCRGEQYEAGTHREPNSVAN